VEQERSKKKLLKCLDELRGCKSQVAKKPVSTSNAVVTKIQEARIEAHKRLAERGETFGWPLPAGYRVYAPGEERQPAYV